MILPLEEKVSRRQLLGFYFSGENTLLFIAGDESR